jgi:hypothetical protein
LPTTTRLFALESKLREIRGLPGDQFLDQVERFVANHHASKPIFPEVDTKSNLWPNVLQELLDAADINLHTLAVHQVSIKTLVSRRNKIAHGNQELISEIAYYRNFENAVYDLMYELAFSIDERLRRPPYV